MKIGIIDADLLGRHKHRFPNLACEKISGYWKAQGADVTLLMDYDHIDEYDNVYVSKVFTDTPVPEWLTETEKVHIPDSLNRSSKLLRLYIKTDIYAVDPKLSEAFVVHLRGNAVRNGRAQQRADTCMAGYLIRHVKLLSFVITS